MAGGYNVNPRFGKRSWVKLWVNEWLDGTTRFEMSDAQRAFWTDLMALAGRSRFPGRICAGESGGSFVGYPLNKFQALMSTPIDIEQTFALFVRAGKISLTVTSEEPKLVMVELLNWDKYQSEYQRQKPYREAKREGYKKSDNPSNNTEGDKREKKKESKTLVRSGTQPDTKPSLLAKLQTDEPEMYATGEAYNSLAARWGKPQISTKRLLGFANRYHAANRALAELYPGFSFAELLTRVENQSAYFRDKWQAWDLEWLLRTNKDEHVHASKVWLSQYSDYDKPKKFVFRQSHEEGPSGGTI